MVHYIFAMVRYFFTHAPDMNLLIDLGANHCKMHQCDLYIYKEHWTRLVRIECSEHTAEKFWKKNEKTSKSWDKMKI